MRQNGQGRCRLAVLASHPIQYFTPLYKRLAKIPELELEVMFCRDFGVAERYDKQFGRAFAWDTDQLGGYKHRFLTNLSPIRDTFNPLHAVNPGAFTRLLRGFDALWLNGYTYPSNWLALAGAKLRGTALLMRSDFRIDPGRAPKRTDVLRNCMLEWWVRRSDALLYIGEANREAYQQFGARSAQLYFSPFSVDVDRLTAVRNEVRPAIERYRASWKIPTDRCVVLFVGKFTPGKHPESVLRLAESPPLRDRIHVVFAGSGPLEQELRESTASKNLTNVSFLGFVNQSRLPEVYALSDIFVMPAVREAWGLVLNEAMVAGAVPVVSSEVGASADLVRGHETGIEIRAGDNDALHDAVLDLVDNPARRARLSAAAIARASEYSYDASVQGILTALESLRLLPRSNEAR
jgi:glycosyltransferase involved in cell wall biosynthesis